MTKKRTILLAALMAVVLAMAFVVGTAVGACGDSSTPGLARELIGWLVPWCNA